MTGAQSLAAIAALMIVLAAPAARAADCTDPAAPEGTVNYNPTGKVLQYCNGTTWINTGSPSSGVFDSRIGTLTAGNFCNSDGTLVNCATSAINLASQVTGILPSGNGGSKWSGSPDIAYTGGMVGIGTSTPTATLDVNGPAKFGTDSTGCTGAIAGRIRWNATDSIYEFCNGSAWSPFKDCATCTTCKKGIAVGEECPDGTVFAGFSPDGNYPMYTTHCNLGSIWNGSSCTAATQYTWKGTGNPANGTVTTGLTSFVTGKSNSSALALRSDADSPYLAAQGCENLVTTHTGTADRTDWYLPSIDELGVLCFNKNAIGNLVSGSLYSSTEFTMQSAWYANCSGQARSGTGKGSVIRVRCVRREGP